MSRSFLSLVVVLLVACESVGGQSGTDQFDVGHSSPTTGDAEGPAETSTFGVEPVDSLPDTDLVVTAEPEPDVLPEVQMICDGSEGIRFSSLRGQGGPVAYYNAFLAANFIVIDGGCRYWLNGPGLYGLRSGILSPEEGEQISMSLHYGQYLALSTYESVQCPDGGGWTLTDATHNLICRCGSCNFSEPQVFQDTFAAVWALEADLSARDERAWGPSSILPYATTAGGVFLPWTLDLNLADVAYANGEQPFAEDSGVRIDDPEQLALLQTLREETLMRGETQQLFVSDADGNGYTLDVRDEPPAAVLNALSAEAHQ